jgi:hypothetical protein
MHAALPRTVLLVEHAIARLSLRAVPPLSYSASLAIFAVTSAMLIPQLFGGLLAMQALALMAIAMLILFLGLRQQIWHDLLSRPDTVHDQGRAEIWTESFDAFFLTLLALSFKLGGPLGPLEFLVLAGATVVGAVRSEHDTMEVAALGVRFLVAAVALAIVRSVFGFGMPEDLEGWAGAPGSTFAAGIDFHVLTLAETLKI